MSDTLQTKKIKIRTIISTNCHIVNLLSINFINGQIFYALYLVYFLNSVLEMWNTSQNQYFARNKFTFCQQSASWATIVKMIVYHHSGWHIWHCSRHCSRSVELLSLFLWMLLVPCLPTFLSIPLICGISKVWYFAQYFSLTFHIAGDDKDR